MYPYQIFAGLTLYDVMITLGIIVCFFSFSFLADRAELRRKLQNFSLIVGVCSIALGFGSAILFQAFYNIESTGRFEIVTNTGATFYGGLIGGVSVFLIAYFALGRLFFKDGYHSKSFFHMARCAVPSIVVAHGFGRVGCLFAGCCHGSPTDAWFGISMHGDMGYIKYVPVQLFEAIFLFALFAFLFYNARKGRSYNLAVYAIGYGIWRFCIEYARADYRGSIPFVNVTPSQLIAVVMVALGIGLVFLEKFITGRQKGEQNNGAE